MIAALLTAVLAAGPSGPVLLTPLDKSVNPVVTKVREKQESIDKLKRDIFKVDRSIIETERLIARSRTASYLPDLQFRLAELYVEKSRYVYYLQAEQRAEGTSGAMVSPETRLFKQKAVQLYYRLLREYPDFHDGDKVTFYLAHEQRELGQFDDMLSTLRGLIDKYPKSELRLESEQILGDYWFDKANLDEAERHYQAILAFPPSPVSDLARYKMGWIRVNQQRFNDAVGFFEAAAGSPPIPGVDSAKALNVKREALLDLVYSYTEARPAKGALPYFEKLSDSRSTYALALDKLGNRYFIKQQYEWAIPTLRKLMEIQPDPELDMERAEKIYDSLRASKGKVPTTQQDIKFLVRAAVNVKVDAFKDETTRRKQLAELEEITRDLATQLQTLAQKTATREAYLDAATAYKEYLSLFRPEKYVRDIMHNRADSLFAARAFPEAARQFEELQRYEERAKDAKGMEAASYGALLSSFSALKPGEVEQITAFEVADARQALKIDGAAFISKYPRNPNVVTLKFNIARAYYDDGEFEKSSQLFTAFALEYPEDKDAPAAGKLALDGLRQINDFKGIEETARKFLASSRLPATFLAEVRRTLSESKGEALGELALQSSAETGDVVEGLLKVASENKSNDIGEKALYGAFSAAREKHDFTKERQIGAKFMADYPKSSFVPDIANTLGHAAAEAGRFTEAAQWYEQVGARMGNDPAAFEGWMSGGRLREAMHDYPAAIKDFSAAAAIPGNRRADAYGALAQVKLRANDLAGAKAAAEAALKLDKSQPLAASVYAEASSKLGGERPDVVARTLATVVNSPNGQGEETARGLWYLGDMLYRNFKTIPADHIDQKVAALQQLQGVYNQSASMGSAEWAVASLWKLGLALQSLAETVEATPVPAGATAAQAQQFKTAVQQQVQPIKDQAEEAFKTCLARASQLEVYSEAVLGCRSKSESVRSPLPSPGSPGALPGNIAELQRQAEAKQDAASMEALGLAYLDARQMGQAQLTLSRATELQETRASAQNALGIALLYQGEPMLARAAYDKALEADPAYDKARANLAALKCRYGDVEGARKELAQVKNPASVHGSDVDPDWRACK
ncbi:MAG: tetratricopeptide repeat protein [Myxococcaceae bacterium]